VLVVGRQRPPCTRRSPNRQGVASALGALFAIALPLAFGVGSAAAASQDLMRQTAKLIAGFAANEGDCGVSVAASGDRALVAVDATDGTSAMALNKVLIFSRLASGIWSEEASLSVSTLRANDRFGSNAAIVGSTVVVGAAGDASGGGGSRGSAYVFEGSTGSWSQVGRLTGSSTAAKDQFGAAVALTPSTLVVGAPGHGSLAGTAYAFSNASGTWAEQFVFTHVDLRAGDLFGYSVAVDGDMALVGAPYHRDRRGAAFLFSRNGSAWSFEATIEASAGHTDDQFGCSVALRSGRALVGAVGFASSAGTAYMFVLRDAAPTDASVHYIVGTSSFWWQEVVGVPQTLFGDSVALSDDFAAVGSPGATGARGDRGARTGVVYFYTRAGGTWSSAARLDAEDGTKELRMGHSVALLGKSAIAGACRYQGNRHSAYVFEAVDCNAWQCGGGFAKKSPLGSCVGTFCSELECCEAADTCSTSDCGANYTLKAALPTFCSSANCTQAECCVPLGACSAAVCGVGFGPAASLPVRCVGGSCTQAECCGALGQCSSGDCRDGLVPKPVLPTYCQGLACAMKECCDGSGTCSSSICPSSHMPRQTVPEHCENRSCAVGECCDPLGTCSDSLCPDEWQLKATLPQHCSGASCTQQECCAPLSNCSSLACGAGYVPKLSPPEICEGMRCFRWECCDVVYGSCSAMDCNASWVKKRELPKRCEGERCAGEECCGPAGVCSVTECGEGWSFRSFESLSCSRTECLQEECCSKVPAEPQGPSFKMPEWLMILGIVCVSASLLLSGLLAYILYLTRKLRLARLNKVKPHLPEFPEGGEASNGPSVSEGEQVVALQMDGPRTAGKASFSQRARII